MNYTFSGPSVRYPIGVNMNINKPVIAAAAETLLAAVGDVPITLWCRGSSGAIIAAVVSLSFSNCIINHIKKPGESAHYTGVDVPSGGNRINIIIDDLIGTGTTVNAIYEYMTIMEIRVVDYLVILDSVNIWKLRFAPLNVVSDGVHNYNPN